MPETLSDEGFLENLVRLQPSEPDRWISASHFLYEDLKRIVGPHGRVWGQEVTGKLAAGARKAYNVIVDLDGGPAEEIEETIMLYGHYDVVQPVKEYAQVSHIRQSNQLYKDPEQPNLVYGLGTEDMNGPNTAIRSAIAEILAGQEDPAGRQRLWARRRLRALLVFGEEGWSPGFQAAYEGGLFEGVDGCVTPEILVNKAPLRMQRAVGYGRLGRYTLTVACSGEAPHIGAVTDEMEHRLTRMLERRAEDVLRKELQLQKHPNPEGVMPNPRVALSSWAGEEQGGITPPGHSEFRATIHYADHNETLSSIVQRVQARLTQIAREIFPGDSDDERRKRENAFRVIPGEHPIGFAKPYKDDLSHPLHAAVRGYVYDAYRQHANPGWNLPLEQTVQPIADTGVADCGRIAHLGIPVAGIFPLGGPWGNPKDPRFSGGGAHTYEERFWMPWIKEASSVIQRIAAEPRRITVPRKRGA